MSFVSFMKIFISISIFFIIGLTIRYYNRRKKQKEFLYKKLKKLIKLRKTIQNCRKIISRKTKQKRNKKKIYKRKEEQVRKLLMKNS